MLILLITHIIIAISGIVIAGAALYTLSPKFIQGSYVLTASTIITGSGLVLMTGNLLKGCLSGLLYVVVAIGLTQTAKQKLAKQKI